MFSRLFLLLGLLSCAQVDLWSQPLDLPPASAFTVVVIPDTQGYRGRATKHSPESKDPLTNPVFLNHVRWIVEHRTEQKIVFVSHVGDIVDINNHAQWQLAKACLDELHGVIPYGLTVGNHDMESNGDASLYQRYFPAERFRGFSWYGGCYEPDRVNQAVSGNNVNSFQLFSAGGLEFVHLNLECNAPDDVVKWADEVLSSHSHRRALITTHMDLGPLEKPADAEDFVRAEKGRMKWGKIHGSRGNTPAELWDKLYARHANLGFIFSGDQSRSTAMTLSRQGVHGNDVHALLSDYTSSGPLRLYRFVPAENRVDVITYDTTRQEIVTATTRVPSRAEHQRQIPYQMTR